MSDLELIRDTHYKGLSGGDVDLAVSCFTDDVETTSPYGELHGIGEFRQMCESFITAASNIGFTTDRTHLVGDTVITEGVFSGTHTGPLVGAAGTIPATGKSFSFAFADVMQVRDGKIASHRIYWDNLSFMAQLGVVPG